MDFLSEISSFLPPDIVPKARPSFLDVQQNAQKSNNSDYNERLIPTSPIIESGYGTVDASPDTEIPPTSSSKNSLDFWQICEKLKSIITLPEKEPAEAEAVKLQVIIKPVDELTNYTGIPCNFWICNKPKLDFDCVVTGPSGLKIKVSTNLELSLGYFKMSFIPVEIGVYTVEILKKKSQEGGFPLAEDEACYVENDSANNISDDEKFHNPKENEIRHVVGSPFNIIVHRNYAIASFRRPIVSIDMELLGGNQISSNEMVIGRKPWGIAANPLREQIIVTDREHHHVMIYSADGTPYFEFGQFGEGAGQFRRPTGVAYDSVKDRLYITDKDNHRVQVFSSVGLFLFAFGSRGRQNGQFSFPWGIAVSKCGRLIVIADSRNHRLQLFSSEGKFIRKYANPQFVDYPRDVDFDHTGQHIFATDFNLHHVIRIDVNFTSCTKLVDDSQLKRPQGIHLDSTGQLIVSNSRQNSVKIFDPRTGTLLQEVTQIDISNLDLPLNAVSVRGGYLAILDLNGRISVF